MERILKQFHWLIIGWTAWTVFEIWTLHNEEVLLLQEQIPVIEQRIVRKTKERSDLKNYFKDIEEAKQRIELVAQEVERVQRKLPSEISDTENLSLFKKVADGLNIKNVYLAPGIEENKGFYFVKRYEFKGLGTYLQFLIFFEKLGLTDRLLNIKSVSVTRGEGNQRGRFQISTGEAIIEAYRYNPDYKEDRGIQNIESDFSGGGKTSSATGGAEGE
jgi:Tfp pilus assembly protein PilO